MGFSKLTVTAGKIFLQVGQYFYIQLFDPKVQDAWFARTPGRKLSV